MRIVFFTWLAALVSALAPPASGQGADLTQLIADLGDPDKKKRRQAAYELDHLGPKAAEAVPALVKALNDDESQVVFHAITALARIGPKADGAVPDLIKRLGRQGRRYGEQVQIRAAFALSRIGSAAVPALREALCEQDEQTCAFAADALGLMSPEVSEPATEELLLLLGDERTLVAQRVSKALARHGQAAVPTLERIVREGSSAEQADAIRTLGLIGKEARASGGTIAEALESGSDEVVAEGVEALVRVRHEATATTGAIVEALASNSTAVWEAAANAALLQASLVPDLDTRAYGEALSEIEQEELRLRFADVLGRIGPAAAPCVPVLIQSALIASTPENAEALARAIAGIGKPAAELTIASAESAREETLPESWQAKAIRGMGDDARDALVAGLSSDAANSRALSAIGLGLLGTEAHELAAALLPLLGDPNSMVRGHALVALPRVGVPTEQLLPRLEPLLSDKSEVVRKQAYESLGRIEKEPQRAMAFLIAGLKDPSTVAQVSAIEAIGELGEAAESAAPQLIELLDASGDLATEVERTLIASLGKIGSKDAAVGKALVPWVGNPDAEVRALALDSLTGLDGAARPAVSAIHGALKDPAPDVRVKAITAIAVAEPDANKLTEALLEGLRDSSSEVQTAAITALTSQGEQAKSAAPRLFALLNEESDIEVKPILDAIRSVRVRDLDLYLSIVHHRSPAVRLFACEAIGRFGSRAKKALPELRKLENDEYDFVSRRARQAIERIEKRR